VQASAWLKTILPLRSTGGWHLNLNTHALSCTHANKHTHIPPPLLKYTFARHSFLTRAKAFSAERERKRGMYARTAECAVRWMHELFINAPTRPNSLFISKFRWCCALSLSLSLAGCWCNKWKTNPCEMRHIVSSWKLWNKFSALCCSSALAGLTFVSGNLVIVTARDVAHGRERGAGNWFLCASSVSFLLLRHVQSRFERACVGLNLKERGLKIWSNSRGILYCPC
jgi:hypothetical protein